MSACREGIGDLEFYNLLSEADNPSEVLLKIQKGYKLGYHKAGKIAQLCNESSIFAVTGLEDSILKSIFMKPYSDLQNAINDAIKLKGSQTKVGIFPFGSLTIPKLISCD